MRCFRSSLRLASLVVELKDRHTRDIKSHKHNACKGTRSSYFMSFVVYGLYSPGKNEAYNKRGYSALAPEEHLYANFQTIRSVGWPGEIRRNASVHAVRPILLLSTPGVTSSSSSAMF